MSEFNVKPKQIKSVATNLEKCNKELKQISDAILTIQKNLAISTTQGDDIIRTMNSIESSILDEAVQASNLGKALEYIAGIYEQSEQKILAYEEGSRGILDYISDRLKDAGLTILKWLGLDDDYYRQKVGYEQFDEARTQEKLMDMYMQGVIADMLSDEKYSEKTWNAATLEERKKILGSFISELNRIMGMDVDTNIRYESMDPRTRGYFTYPANTVSINEDYLDPSNANSYMIMRTMIHEMRHAYQHTAVDNPEDFIVSEETLQQWEKNFGDYKTTYKDGYDAYVTQAIEYDAKSFAEQYQDIIGYTPKYEGSWG